MSTRTHAVPRGGFLSTLVLVALVAAAWPTPVQATHAQLEGPREGTTVQGWTVAGFGNLTFAAPEERLAGYHEWRDVVTTSIQRPGEEQPWGFGPVYDLETGAYLGGHIDIGIENPGLGEPLAQLGVAYRFEHRELAGHLGVDPLLPESLLWARYLWPGESWAVAALSWGPDPVAVRVAVEEGEGEADLIVFVERTSFRAGVGTVWEWRLGLHGDDRVFAAERALRVEPIGTPREESTWHPLPMTLVEPGGDPLRFGGLSHVPLADGPDQLMTFGTVGALPDDPAPHPMFDVAEAAAAAWASGHEAVRAFRAQADDPYLVAAQVSGLSQGDASVRWSLRWLEADGKALWVDFAAYKTPWTPLVPTSFDAELEASDERATDAEERNGTRTVQPGSYARYFDAFAAERGRPVTGYDWSLQASSAFNFTSAGGELARLQDVPYHSCPLSVEVDGATGIVVRTTVNGFSMLPDASCRHEYGYAALDPVGSLP